MDIIRRQVAGLRLLKSLDRSTSTSTSTSTIQESSPRGMQLKMQVRIKSCQHRICPTESNADFKLHKMGCVPLFCIMDWQTDCFGIAPTLQEFHSHSLRTDASTSKYALLFSRNDSPSWWVDRYVRSDRRPCPCRGDPRHHQMP